MRSERASERSLSVTASKSGLRVGFKARANGRASEKVTRMRSVISAHGRDLRARFRALSHVCPYCRATRARSLLHPTCSIAAHRIRHEPRELSARNVNIAPDRRDVRCLEIDALREKLIPGRELTKSTLRQRNLVVLITTLPDNVSVCLSLFLSRHSVPKIDRALREHRCCRLYLAPIVLFIHYYYYC